VGRCRLLFGFLPSSGDGADYARCFWKHRFPRDTQGVYLKPQPIPKIIWSFWSQGSHPNHYKDFYYDSWATILLHRILNLGVDVLEALEAPITKEEVQQAPPQPPFIDLCVATWRTLNPDYKIEVLNETTVWNFLDRKELPKQYDKLDLAHQADAIRLALLLRYGGIWIDSSTLLLQPLSEIIGTDPSRRFFFTTDNKVQDRQERRVDRRFYVENWFLRLPQEISCSSAPRNATQISSPLRPSRSGLMAYGPWSSDTSSRRGRWRRRKLWA
jgi:hypothetical protein